MTGYQLQAALSGFRPTYDYAWIIYSPAPGVGAVATNFSNFNLPFPVGAVLYLLASYLNVPPLTVASFSFLLGRQPPSVLAGKVYIPTVAGNLEVQSVTLLGGDPPGSPAYVALNGPWTAPFPAEVSRPGVPGNRKQQSPARWPNIQVADP